MAEKAAEKAPAKQDQQSGSKKKKDEGVDYSLSVKGNKVTLELEGSNVDIAEELHRIADHLS